MNIFFPRIGTLMVKNVVSVRVLPRITNNKKIYNYIFF